MPGYLGAGKNTWRTTPVGVIQSGDWKLMEFFEDGHLELYELASDLVEMKNLASANPDKTAELHTKLKAWRAETGAAMPTPNTGASTDSAKGKGGKKKGKGKGKAKTKAEA
jgi:arylsulfatase A-like enzyme